MRVVLVPDKFKDSLSAKEVAQAIAAGLHSKIPEVEICNFAASDGGDGFLAAIASVRPMERKFVKTLDPLGRVIRAEYLWDTDARTAYIELAKASGLELLKEKERNPLLTGTKGTGILIREAIDLGAKRVFVGLGGSATNDGGMGIAAAFGYRFYDAHGNTLEPIGDNLDQIRRIEKPNPNPISSDIKIFAVNDVTNPLWGTQGAAPIYAPQKGADPAQVLRLNAGLKNLDEQVFKAFGLQTGQTPGSGAAGGAAFGLQVFLGASFLGGASFILDYSGFKAELKTRQIDLIITGEGKIDAQTLQGKFIQGVLELGAQHKIPVGAICGKCTLTSEILKSAGFAWVLEAADPAQSLSWNLTHAATRIRQVVASHF